MMAVLIMTIVVAIMLSYKAITKKKLSPIMLIVVSAAVGIVVNVLPINL